MSAIADGVKGIVAGFMEGADDLFTSDDERLAWEFKLTELFQKPHIIQALTTLQEAKHTNWFVAGWRPGIGWVCVAGIAWAWVLRPLVQLGLYVATLLVADADQAKIAKQIADNLPQIDTAQLIGMVTTLLGLGGARMYERAKGVARES